MRTFDNDSKLKTVISSTTLLVEPGKPREEQIAEITAQIERLVQAHLQSKASLK